MNFLKRLWLRRDQNGVYRPRSPNEIALDERTLIKMVRYSGRAEAATRENLPTEVKWMESSIAVLITYHGMYLSKINNEDEDTVEIAQIMLLCRFANALYAAARLGMMGLSLEAIGQLRSALEALQFSRLIHIEEDFAKIYLHPEKALKPVEVRKELESRGHDVGKARAQYSSLSTTSHIGGFGDSLVLEPTGDRVTFNIGGYVDIGLQKRILEDCHLAVGEYIAFHAGIRQEDVDRYHAEVKAIAAKNSDPSVAIDEINSLLFQYQSKRE